MHKILSLVLIALLSSAGITIAAENKESSSKSGIVGPDPTHVTGSGQSGAAATGSGGTGLSAESGTSGSGGQGTNKGKQTDGSGTAYIDCPGNAFSGGIRSDTKGVKTDCVSPDSVPIQGSDNLKRDNSKNGHAVGNPSGANTSGSSNPPEENPNNRPDVSSIGSNDVQQGNSASEKTGK